MESDYTDNAASPIMGEKVMPGARSQYESEKRWILIRIAENLDSKKDDDLALDSSIDGPSDELADRSEDIDPWIEMDT
jgi:hypothetical protein